MKLRINSVGEIVLTGAVLSTFLTRIFLLIRMPNYHENAVIAENLLQGTPPWRVFQNRILGAIVQTGLDYGIGLLGLRHSPSIAFDLYVFLALIGVIVVYRLVAIALFSELSQQIAYFAAILLCYIFIQDKNWLYPWDLIEVASFGVLYLLIVKRRPVRDFWLLFAVAAINKETAAAIGLWLLFDSISFKDGRPTNLRPGNITFSLPKAVSGLAIAVISLIIANVLRSALYRHNDALTGGAAVVDTTGNFLAAIPNIHTLLGSLFFGNILFFAVFLFLALTAGLFLWRALSWRSLAVYDLKILLFGLALVAAFFVFCRIDEIRGLNYALPYIAHAALVGRFTRYRADEATAT